MKTGQYHPSGMKTLKVTIYDYVQGILDDPDTNHLKNSDKALTWFIWKKLGFAFKQRSGSNYFIQESEFMDAPNQSSIARARRMLSAEDPEQYGSDEEVAEYRKKKEQMKGTHVFNESARTGELQLKGAKVKEGMQ